MTTATLTNKATAAPYYRDDMGHKYALIDATGQQQNPAPAPTLAPEIVDGLQRIDALIYELYTLIADAAAADADLLGILQDTAATFERIAQTVDRLTATAQRMTGGA